MAGFDKTNPTDNAIVSQYPPNERAQRAAVASAFGLEHDSDGTGRHKFPTGDTSARDAITGMNEGTLFVNTSAGAGNYYIEIYASATSVWETTGRFTSADEVKLDAIISAASATSATAASATSSAFQIFTPYFVGVAADAAITRKVATQVQTEDASTTSQLTTPGRQHFHPSAAKAWGKFTGSTGTLTASYNVTSVARDTTGQWTVHIANEIGSSNYSILVTARGTSNDVIAFVKGGSTITGGLFTITCRNYYAADAANALVDAADVFFVIYGDI